MKDGETLEKLNEWRQCYNRTEHLLKNWKTGVYHVAQIPRGHKSTITAFDSNGIMRLSI